MPWKRKSCYSGPSIPPAGGFTVSSANRRAESRKIPHRFRRRGKKPRRRNLWATAQIRESYRSLFPGANVDVSLIENMVEMGHYLTTLARRGEPPHAEVFVTTHCFAALGKSPELLMCHFSRSRWKRRRRSPCGASTSRTRIAMNTA